MPPEIVGLAPHAQITFAHENGDTAARMCCALGQYMKFRWRNATTRRPHCPLPYRPDRVYRPLVLHH